MASSQQSLRSYLNPFLDYCEVEKGLADNTQRNYRHYLQLFFTWLEKTNRKKLKPRELTAELVWEYRLYMARNYKTQLGKRLGKKSQNFYLIALRALLSYLADRDIETLPATKVKLAKQKDEHAISFLDGDEIERILEAPDIATIVGLRDRAIMETLFSSGTRIAELVALDVGQVAPLTRKTRAAPKTLELSIVGKGKHIRTIFISSRAVGWIRDYLIKRGDDAKPLFINTRSKNHDDQRLTPRSIQLQIAKYARAAGITKKVTPHTLRHSYATDLLTQGADLRSVQELLGHKNVSTTQIYTHVTNKRLRDVHERFHGRQHEAR